MKISRSRRKRLWRDLQKLNKKINRPFAWMNPKSKEWAGKAADLIFKIKMREE